MEALIDSQMFDGSTTYCTINRGIAFFNGIPEGFRWHCPTNPFVFNTLCGVQCLEYDCVPRNRFHFESLGYAVSNAYPEGLSTVVDVNGGIGSDPMYESVIVYPNSTKPSELGQVTCMPGHGGTSTAVGIVGIACRGDGLEFEPYGCQACPAGTFSGVASTLPCEPCPVGTNASGTGSTACGPCAAGMYQGHAGSTDCLECSAGTFTDTAGLSGCKPCPIGQHNDKPGSGQCVKCDIFGTFYTSSQAGSTECDGCLASRYRNLAGQCIECDTDSMDCGNRALITLPTLMLHEGYHRGTNETDVPYIKKCPHMASCLGGAQAGDASCKNGTSGPVCAVCWTDYYMDEQTTECIECGDWTKPVLNTVVLLLVTSVCCGAVYRQQQHVQKALESMGKRSRSHLQFVLRASIMPKVKIIVPFVNLLSVLGWVYGADDELFMVEEVQQLMRFLDLLSLDLGGSIPLGCFTERTALLSLVVSTVPLVGFTLLLLAVVRVADRSRHQLSDSVKDMCYSGLVFVWLLMFPIISSKIFKVLRGCDQFEHASYMRAAYNVDCDSSEYDATVLYGAFAILVYPVGAPLATLAVLWTKRGAITTYQSMQVHMQSMLQSIRAINEELSGETPDVQARRSLLEKATFQVSRAQTLIAKAADSGSDAAAAAPGNKILLNGQSRAPAPRADALHGYALRQTLQGTLELLQDMHVQLSEASAALTAGRTVGSPGDDGASRAGSDWMAMAYETYGYYTVWWWEVFENARKLTMMGMVVVIAAGSYTDRLFIGIAVEAFSLFLYGRILPFRDPVDNVLAQACRAITIAVLLYLLAVDIQHIDPGSSESRRAFAVMVSTTVSGLVVYAVVSSGVLKWVYVLTAPTWAELGRLLQTEDDKGRVLSIIPERPEVPACVEAVLANGGDRYLQQLFQAGPDEDGADTSANFPARKTSKSRSLFGTLGGRSGKKSSAVAPSLLSSTASVQGWSGGEPVPGPEDPEQGITGPKDDGLADPQVQAAGSPDEQTRDTGSQIDELLGWVVEAAAAAHFHPETQHNLKMLLGMDDLTLSLEPHIFDRLRQACRERMAQIGERLRVEADQGRHCETAGSASLHIPSRRLTGTVHETTQGQDRVAQDNQGVLFTPTDWDWSVQDIEKVWIHVLVMLSMAIQDRFHSAVESVMVGLHGDGFDGFFPGPVKSYGRMLARMMSKEDHLNRAQPRPNLNLDVVRCTIKVPTVDDLGPSLHALAGRFGALVKVENGYDMTPDEAAGRFHLRTVIGSVVFESGLTVGDLVRDAQVLARWSEYAALPGFQDNEPNARRSELARRAIEFMLDKRVGKTPVNMICEIQMVTRSVGETRDQMHELYKILRAPDAMALYRDYNKSARPPSKTLLEAAQQGEFDLVERMLTDATEQERRQALAAAESRDHWETVSVLQKTFVTRMSIPDQIDTTMSNNMQGMVQSLWKERVDVFWPTTILSYATGSRAGVDDPGAGPGLYLCAMLIMALDAAGIDSFSGLHVLPGQHWRTTYYDRLSGPKSQAKVMIVLLTQALYRSMACLGEVFTALEQGLELIPIRAEAGLPPSGDQWPINMWGDQKEDEEDDAHQARVSATLSKIKKVKKGLGSYNHLPPRGLFQDLVNVEMGRLLDLLVNKIGAVEPVKVFASMRFLNGKPLDEAIELQARLASMGIELLIVKVAAGDSIHQTVFDTSMAKCVGFVAMGSATYGQDTGSDASSHCEVLRWNEQYSQAWGPIIPVRLIGQGEDFMNETGKQVFSTDALQVWWTDAEAVAKEVALAISKRIKQHPFIDGQTTPSMDWMVEKTKSFLWQAERSQDAAQDHVEAKPPLTGHPALATPTESTQTRNEQAPTDIATELKSGTKQYKALVSQSTELTPDQKAQKMHLKTRIKELKAAKASEALNAQSSQVTAKGSGLALEEAVDPVDEKRMKEIKRLIKAMPPKEERNEAQNQEVKRLKGEFARRKASMGGAGP